MPPENSTSLSWILSYIGRGTCDEEEPVYGGADHWDIEAARGGSEDRGSVPGAWDQRGDVLRLEVEVRGHGRERGAAAKGDGRREPSAEAVGGGVEPEQRSAESSDKKKRLELAGLREDVAFASAEYQLSERRACKLLGAERSSYRYEPRPDRNVELREELVQLARQKPRYGYRRLHAVLSRRGHEVNVKRVYRLYVEERLVVRRRKRKRLVREQRRSHG